MSNKHIVFTVVLDEEERDDATVRNIASAIRLIRGVHAVTATEVTKPTHALFVPGKAPE